MNIFMFALSGAGKDTVADILSEHHGIVSTALADPIREEYVLRLDRNDHKQNRPLMIKIGETYKELYGRDVWCRAAMKFIENDKQRRSIPTQGYLIRDGRYQHEYGFFVEQHGFIPVKIVASEQTRLARLQARDGDTQVGALDFERKHFIDDSSFAYVLNNDGSISELSVEVRHLVETLRKDSNGGVIS